MTKNSKYRRLHGAILVAVALASLAACSLFNEETVKPITKIGEPQWVATGTGAYIDGKLRLLIGIGIASNMQSPELLMQVADSRAIKELSGVINAYAALTADSYLAAGAGADIEQIRRETKAAASRNIANAHITKRWTNPATGAVYSLAVMEAAEFAAELKDDKQLAEFMVKNAEIIHDRIMSAR